MGIKKAFLIILDGWGHGEDPEVSAVAKARTPVIDTLYKDHLHANLTTFGSEVGLPDGQMGNSEVGHLNIGAGRVVFQELARINNSIADGSLSANATIVEALNYAKANNKSIHFLGLLSDGGVHSHIHHLQALIDITNKENIPTHVHAFLDGRDTAPDGGKNYLKELLDHMEGTTSKLSSVIGRYFSMDRDKRWDRIKKAYDLLVHGEGVPTTDVLQKVQEQYDKGTTDEFMEGLKLGDKNEGTLKKGDVVFFINFRTDRPRQLTEALTQMPFPDHEMSPLDLYYVSMTKYKESYKNVHVVFEKDPLLNTMGEVLAKAGKSQLRAAETEKYPHVTFFFSGGEESTFEDEARILVNSPNVATYDLKPSMSAVELKDAVIDHIKSNTPDFICLNFANADMVGHTGIMAAAVEAVETVDQCLGDLLPTALNYDYEIIIIADHGNSDIMINPDGSPHTAHTTNLVPVIYVSNSGEFKQLRDGKLADIAPTLLTLMDVDIPSEMTGNVLLS